MSAIAERARAKINLTLRVLGRRADGYHLLESLIVFAGVGDEVVFEPGGAPAVTMTGPYATAIVGDNLVETALEALAAADPDLTLGGVSIDKRLPIAAGIGGGSSDAAAVLRVVRRINPTCGVEWNALAAAAGRRCFGLPRRSRVLRVGRRRARRAGGCAAAARRRARLSAKRRPVRQDKVCVRPAGCGRARRGAAARTVARVPGCRGADRLYAQRRQ